MIRVYNNISLRERNSFHIDVTAKSLIEYSSIEDLREIFSHYAPKSWVVLSGGNNILFTQDVEQTIITPISTEIEVLEDDQQSQLIKVDAGVEWDDVVEWCVSRDLWGVENLSLIPGKAGAAPIQNIGAYGAEVCDVLCGVEYFDTVTGELLVRGVEECQFGYRDSIFKRELKGRVVVTAILLRLSKVAKPNLRYADIVSRVESRGDVTLRAIRDVICEVRREKLPDTAVLGNAGSFFKNPIVDVELAERLLHIYPDMPMYSVEGEVNKRKLAAGWLIDQAKMKGYRDGCVGVHSKQALVLVNMGGASGADLLSLARRVQCRVRELFGVDIESEVNIL